ncbi:MAG: DUF262 domain-containing protein [Candidatus Nitrohelix vancouverensis]|uniref:DUF262 domain-containing protein n=1 Tax=Candidatus Nitrohelix vancouverensis TaxID=2705534 RepID=A0A7T0C2P4_9BACT|nr:MAG: DUF262 domain-containing protein [Candidatus Nitrohelix vancouverensis]
MRKTKQVIASIKEEENDYYSDDDIFSISSWGADLSFRELIDRYENDELEKPELQRKYVWDKTEASRFVESILLGLPVPSIFLAKTNDEKMLIIDGYQRIMTVHDFVKGTFSTDKKLFRLSNSKKINRRWRGKSFSELSEADQRRVKNTTIHAIIFVQDQPSETNTSMFQVFERINTSGRTLFPQEIRNCIYQGEFNLFLLELNKYKNWRRLFGLSQEDGRMRDIELILRFFALSSDMFKNQEKEKISLKKFLNDFMKANINISDSEKKLFKNRFVSTVDYIFETYGEHAFHNISPTNPQKLTSKLSPTIFDSIMIATDDLLKESFFLHDGEVSETKRRLLLKDDRYRTSISKETMKKDSILMRIDVASMMLYGRRYV